MANLLLTTECQRKCVYCFAEADKHKHMEFEWDNFIAAANFVGTIEPKLINLLGGEPTLHKDFAKMLEYLLTNDFIVQVFTNGMVSDEQMDKISNVINKVDIKKDQLKFVVNVNHESERLPGETEKQATFFKKFNKITFPSFTIHKQVDLSFLLELVKNYSLDPFIRLGLALPTVGGHNKYLPIEEYKEVADTIIDFINVSGDVGITFDCGFVLCMFPMEKLSELLKLEQHDLMFLCGQPVDIYPDLTATNCYSLSNLYRAKLQDFNDIVELYKFFQDGFMTPVGIYGQKCADCQFFRKICFGGCRGFYKPEQQGDS